MAGHQESIMDEKTLSDLESNLDRSESSLDPSSPTKPLFNFLQPRTRAFGPGQIRSVALRTASTLLPSFSRSLLSNERPKSQRLSPTAYLDGMRGLAALFVFFCHYSYTCFVITNGYAYGEAGQNRNLLLLPIIRLLYSGPPMVCVFFVISGYALSLKPLKQMRSRSWDSLMTTMSSSIFRRGLRLFIPTATSTFMVFCMLRLRMYEPTRALSKNKMLHRNIQELHPEMLPTTGMQFRDWAWQMFRFVCVFDWAPFAGSTGYDVHLWTIPVEFRASLFLFLVVIGLSRLRPRIRMTLLSAIFLFVLRNDRWELMLFYSGMFLAEMDIILSPSSPPPSPLSPSPLRRETRSRSPRSVFWFGLALLSLYLMSQPDEGSEATPGWRWLFTMIPPWISEKYRFWQTIGSITLVLAVSRSQPLQSPFNFPAVQYLGKISYALYLMHGPVMHSVGYLVQQTAWGLTGYGTETRYLAGFILAALINIPLVIWAADVFWRLVDTPSVKFARWLEAKLLVDDYQKLYREPRP
jgi:peptidoglycan/LPS O-acetylase OafA/YrhL